MSAELRPISLADPRIGDIVLGLLDGRGFVGVLDVTRDLNEAGLTSVDMVNLMLAIEAEYDVEIPAAELKPENFRTMLAIQALVTCVAGA